MIRYALKCEINHQFESWFQSAEAFEKLKTTGRLCCPDCGSGSVAKAIMAPQVRLGGNAAENGAPERVPMQALVAPSSPAEAAIIELKKKIEKYSDYVGKDFAAEARKIHVGEAEGRSIYGEATGDEARALIEDGIPVAPLPFLPARKTN